MKRSLRQPTHSAPVDLVGIPEPQLREHLEHILAEDDAQSAAPQSLLGLARHLSPETDESFDLMPPEGDQGHEDMLPQLRLVNALLSKAGGETPQPERRPFADVVAAEKLRRQRRKRLSRNADSVEDLPPPSPQAENDRLLLEEIGRRPVHPAGGWVAEPQAGTPPPPTPPDSPAPSSFSLGDEVMDGFVTPPLSPPEPPVKADLQPTTEAPVDQAAEPPPPIQLKIKRKSPPPAPVAEPVAEPVEPPLSPAVQPQATPAKPPVKLKVKGRSRTVPAEASPVAPVETTTTVPPPDEEAPAIATQAQAPVKLKVKGRPRRHDVTPVQPQAEAPAPIEPVATLPTPEPNSLPQLETAPATKPAVKMKVKGKPRRNVVAAPPAAMEPATAIEAAAIPTPQPDSPPQQEAAPAAKPAVKMKVKGKPRRNVVAAPPAAMEPAAVIEAVAAIPTPLPDSPPQPEAAPTAKPAIKMKVKGKPRRDAITTSPAAGETTAPAEEVAAALPTPQPEAEPETAKPAVTMKVKGKPRRPSNETSAPLPEPTAPVQSAQVQTAPVMETPLAANPSTESALPPQDASAARSEDAPGVKTVPDDVPADAPPQVADTAGAAPPIQMDDPLRKRVEDIIAVHTRRTVATAPLRGSHDLPENREALSKLLDDVQPVSDFAALDLVYACWGKTTHDSDSRALLAVAQQISRNFGLPDKLPMASTKAWKMLDHKVFAPELADRLEAVGQFIVDWQKTQRVFLILEFSEIELIEYLFEALSPADYPELLAEVMNFKVLSNRRMGLLRRFPARLRKLTQPMLPDRKEEALVIQAHGKALLQKIADPRGFAPIVEVAGKMLEEVEKLMKQTANTGAPPQLGGPPGGGGALGRIG